MVSMLFKPRELLPPTALLPLKLILGSYNWLTERDASVPVTQRKPAFPRNRLHVTSHPRGTVLRSSEASKSLPSRALAHHLSTRESHAKTSDAFAASEAAQTIPSGVWGIATQRTRFVDAIKTSHNTHRMSRRALYAPETREG
jgi:hypothetical protein